MEQLAYSIAPHPGLARESLSQGEPLRRQDHAHRLEHDPVLKSIPRFRGLSLSRRERIAADALLRSPRRCKAHGAFLEFPPGAENRVATPASDRAVILDLVRKGNRGASADCAEEMAQSILHTLQSERFLLREGAEAANIYPGSRHRRSGGYSCSFDQCTPPIEFITPNYRARSGPAIPPRGT
jgi:hypothetical protein